MNKTVFQAAEEFANKYPGEEEIRWRFLCHRAEGFLAGAAWAAKQAEELSQSHDPMIQMLQEQVRVLEMAKVECTVKRKNRPIRHVLKEKD